MKTEYRYMKISAQYVCEGDEPQKVHEILIAIFEIVVKKDKRGKEVERIMWCLN